MTTTLAQSGISAQNPDRPKRLELLLVGGIGTWKTVTAHTMPATRTLDFDNGMQSVEWAILAGKLPKQTNEIVYETLLPKRGAKLLEERMADVLDRAADVVDEWIDDEDVAPEKWNKPYPQFWDTLIIDSASFMMDTALGLALAENKRIELSESLKVAGKGLSSDRRASGLYVVPMRIQDWGSAGTLFLKAVRQWRALGKNLIITAHEYALINEDTGSLIAIQPNVVGQLRTKLPAAFDEVWYTKVKATSGEPEVVFRVKQEMKREAKTRLGCLSPDEPADFRLIREKVAKFYGVPAESLWHAYHGTEGRERAERELAQESEAI